MFSFPKLIVVVLLIIAAWVSYRWVNGLTRELERRRRASPHPAVTAEELVACGVCGAYVAGAASGCGRPDCPRPR